MRNSCFVIKLQKRKEKNILWDGNISEPLNRAVNAGDLHASSHTHTTSYQHFRWEVYFNARV